MMERDLASASLGMVVEHDEPGHAVVSMVVRDDMTNGFHITHGGFVFALADTAFAIACNEDEHITVAQGADIAFLSTSTGRPSPRRRTACRERPLADCTTCGHRRTAPGSYDGRSRRPTQSGEVVAEMRGRSLAQPPDAPLPSR